MRARTVFSRLKRGSGELLIIVAGVLIALWAEEWRSGRADRNRVYESLAELRVELVEAQSRLSEAITADSAFIEQIDRLVPRIRAGRNDNSMGGRDFALRWTSYVPSLPTLELLAGTADLRLVESDSLRFLLRASAAELVRVRPTLDTTQGRLVESHGALASVGERLWKAHGGGANPQPAAFGSTLMQTLGAMPVSVLHEDPDVTSYLIHYYTALVIRTNRKDLLRTSLEALQAELALVLGD